MNAAGGIYWRSAPDWNTAEAISGFGFYDGTTIAVHCYQSGAGNVPYSADTMWEQATDVAGPGYGSGWINEHFINDGSAINQPSPGVPPCNPAPPPPPTQNLKFTVFNAAGGIFYRNSPRWADTSRIVGVGVYNGDTVQLICGAFGDPVGPYNNIAWSYVQNLSRPSIGDGWVSEHFINDGAASNHFPAGEPMCGSTTPGDPSSGVAFNRNATVAWANAHWHDYQPYPASCTWFVSQALWAGGLPQTPEWTSAGGHGTLQWRPGTASAWWVPGFVSYIMGAYPHSYIRQLTFSPSTNSVPDAQIGDVILYAWHGGASPWAWYYLDHAALIVGFNSGNGPRVAEWGIGGENPTQYQSRFWTWSTASGEWLATKYPGVQAFLLHIDPS